MLLMQTRFLTVDAKLTVHDLHSDDEEKKEAGEHSVECRHVCADMKHVCRHEGGVAAM